MSITQAEFIKQFYKRKTKHLKNQLFNFKGDTLAIGKCTIAVLKDNLVLINETIEMLEVDKVRDLLINLSKSYKVQPIFIPFHYGEEDMPTDEDIVTRLEDRLKYWLVHTQELTNKQIQEQYKAYYEQYKKFLYNYNKGTPNTLIQGLYNQLSDKQYMKALKLRVAKRKVNLK